MISKQIFELIKDVGTFGAPTSLKAMRRRFSNGTIDLNIGQFGKITIRSHDSDYTMLRQVFRDREYDMAPEAVRRGLRDVYSAILARNETPVIVDAGANIGSASIWFSKLYPEARIVAIEPDKDNIEILRRNSERFRQIEVKEAAIGAEPGYVTVVSNGNSATVTTVRASGGCPVITIDQALASVVNGAPFIIKIDIEGFERDLFGSNIDWIDRCAAIFIEPHDWKFTDQPSSESFQRAMGERRFALYISGENLLYVNRDIGRHLEIGAGAALSSDPLPAID